MRAFNKLVSRNGISLSWFFKMENSNFEHIEFTAAVSDAEAYALSELTNDCFYFAKYCEETFNLGVLESYLLAGLAIRHMENLVEQNPLLKEYLERNAKFLQSVRKGFEYKKEEC